MKERIDKAKEYNYKKKPNGKNDTGSPNKYKEEYCDDIVNYFEVCQAEILTDVKFYKGDKNNKIEEILNPTTEKEDETLQAGPVREIVQKLVMQRFPTYVRYARKIGVTKKTLYNRADEHDNFLHSMNMCSDIAEAILLENGLQGTYNSQFAMFLLKNNYGYKDKQEVEQTNINVEATEEQKKELLDRFKIDNI